jgi:hypothetical protein
MKCLVSCSNFFSLDGNSSDFLRICPYGNDVSFNDLFSFPFTD